MYFIAYLSFNFGVGSLCIYVDGMEKQDLSAVKCMLKSFKTPTFFLFNISMVLLDSSSMILYGYFAYGLPIKYSANSLFSFFDTSVFLLPDNNGKSKSENLFPFIVFNSFDPFVYVRFLSSRIIRLFSILTISDFPSFSFITLIYPL